MNACECGCGQRAGVGKRFLHGHWAKANRRVIGDAKRSNRPMSHGDGYLVERVPMRGARLQHLLVAEKVLGHALPMGAVVHHVNQDRSDNRPQNLVICPSNAYHALIHRRMRALAACGHADWRKCQICKRYDRPESLHIPKKQGTGSIVHLECLNWVRFKQRKESQ